jgi:acid phosphatase (class A)
LILSEIAPDRGGLILTRARAYGESRAVCGVHTIQAVEAGRMLGSALVASLHASAEFRKDLEHAGIPRLDALHHSGSRLRG